MRVEIEISEDEAAHLRHNRAMRLRSDCYINTSSTEAAILGRITDATPRPIQVGDAVKFKNSKGGGTFRYVVLALVDNGALLRSTHNGEGEPCTEVLNAADVSRLELVVAAALEKETPQ